MKYLVDFATDRAVISIGFLKCRNDRFSPTVNFAQCLQG